MSEIATLTVIDAAAWRVWLDNNEDSSDGVWLVLAKRGTTEPTSLSYAQALDEALCSGWIDGQKRSLDATTFLQRFTPRRKNSMWSQRNIELVASLTAAGRMRARGQAEIDRAREDGRWERAYPRQSSAEVPEDLATALAGSVKATATFESLNSANRFAILHRLYTGSPATRERRLTKYIKMLEAGESIYPQ